MMFPEASEAQAPLSSAAIKSSPHSPFEAVSLGIGVV